MKEVIFLIYLIVTTQADNNTFWFVNPFGHPDCFTHKGNINASCKNIFQVNDLLPYSNKSVEDNKSERLLQIPDNCTEELGHLGYNAFICTDDFYSSRNLKVKMNEVDQTIVGTVSKCCQMNEIFNAKSNVCENGNFSIEELTFYELKKNSSNNDLVEVIDQEDLKTIGFTHGLLEDADCHGGGRK